MRYLLSLSAILAVALPALVAGSTTNLVPTSSPEEIKVVRVRADDSVPAKDLLASVARAILRQAGFTVPDADAALAHAEVLVAPPQVGGSFVAAAPDVAEADPDPPPVAFRTAAKPPLPVRRDYLNLCPTWVTPRPLASRPNEPPAAPEPKAEVPAGASHGAIAYRTDAESDPAKQPVKIIERSTFALDVVRLIAPSIKKEPVDLLIAALDNKDPMARAFAASSLGLTGERKAVAALAKAIEDADAVVRESAVMALGQLGLEAVDTLVAVLKKNKDPAARAGAADALAEMALRPAKPASEEAKTPPANLLKDTPALAALVLAMEDPSADVRTAAAGALADMESAKAVEALVAHLKDPEPRVREAAASALGPSPLGRRRSPDAAKGLAAALEDDSPWVRREAVQALLALGDAAASPLVAALKSKKPMARSLAAWTLGQLKAAKAIDGLLPLLDDEGWKARAAAAQALGQVGDGRAATPLIKLLKDDDPLVRRAAAWALGRLGRPEAVRPLLEARDDYDHDVAAQVVKAVVPCNIPGAKGETLAAVLVQAVQNGKTADVVSLTKRALKENDFEAQLVGLQALGQPAVAEAVPILITALASANVDVYQAAAAALGRLKAVRAVEPLLTGLGDRLRTPAAAEALVAIGDPQALPYLEAAQRDAAEDTLKETLRKAIDQLRPAKP
jgi:HEAT repeat protein